MFNWLYRLLYSLTKILLQLIDALLSCANKLCGIEKIKVEGQSTDFMTFLINSDEINLAFRVTAVIGLIVIIFFTIFAIIRSFGKEKAETPAQICIKSAKTVLMFLLVPGCMIAFILIVNTFMQGIYQATTFGASSIGQYLFSAFAEGSYLSGKGIEDVINSSFDYSSTSAVEAIVDLSDFSFFYSYICGFAILFMVAPSMLIFVERAISVVILYIAAPISMATSVLDDGARFKLWRDQMLVKFLNGYGVIIGINIYALIIGKICQPSVEFFDNSFLNNIFKIVIITGGAAALSKISAVIGNLISAGAGSNEARENAMMAAKAGGILKSAALSPLSATRGIYNFGRDSKRFGLGSTIASRLGFRTAKDYAKYGGDKKDDSKGGGDDSSGSGNKNDKSPNFTIGTGITNALQGGNQNNNSNNNSNPVVGESNHNDNQPKNGQNMINNALTGPSDSK